MLPIVNRKPKYVGRIGNELNAESGRDALYTAGLNALAAIKAHLGTLDKVTQVAGWEFSWRRRGTSSITRRLPMPFPSCLKVSSEKTKPPCELSLASQACRWAYRLNWK
jgi:hypothetical protein